jgi:hypothetical protein
MPYFKDLNILYLHVPKTGGTSIEQFFYDKYKDVKDRTSLYGWYLDKSRGIRVPDGRSLQHFTHSEIHKVGNRSYFPENIYYDKPKIIISVRCPYDRMISELFWNESVLFDKENLTPEMIEQAIYHYLYTDKTPQDNHRIPQIEFIKNSDGSIIENVDIIRCETLETDMHFLGFQDFLIHNNKNKYGYNNPYATLLNDNAKRMIETYYKEDFEYFGYILEKPRIEIKPVVPYKATIVTAFISEINGKNNRSIDDYIEYGKKLLSIPVPVVCFIELHIYNTYFKEDIDKYPLTSFVITDKSRIYLYHYKDQITQFSIESDDPNKNTLEYMFIQCNKTEWISQAIDLNIYKTGQYIWVDFGIYHMIRDETKMVEGIQKMVCRFYNTLRIASCKYKGYTVPYDVYRIITWTFAGSVFGGDTDSLLRFAHYTKMEVLKTIRERKTLMWEINIWYLIYLNKWDFFDFYSATHDPSILYEY